MDSDLVERLTELNREIGELKKENEMLKIANDILVDKLNHNLDKTTLTEQELKVLVNILDLLFSIKRRTVYNGKRVNYSGKKIIDEDIADKKIGKEKVLKRDIF